MSVRTWRATRSADSALCRHPARDVLTHHSDLKSLPFQKEVAQQSAMMSRPFLAPRQPPLSALQRGNHGCGRRALRCAMCASDEDERGRRRAARLRAGRAAPSPMRKVSRPESCIMAQEELEFCVFCSLRGELAGKGTAIRIKKRILGECAKRVRCAQGKTCRLNTIWALRAHQSHLRTHTASVESLERNTKRHGVDLATDAEMQTTSGGYFLRG